MTSRRWLITRSNRDSPTHPDFPSGHTPAAPSNKPASVPHNRPHAPSGALLQTPGTNQLATATGGCVTFEEHLADLLARGAMNAGAGHAAFPLRKKQVLRRQTFKAAALERIVLGKLHPGLDLALVPWHRRARRQHHRAIVAAELRHLSRWSSGSYQSARVTAARRLSMIMQFGAPRAEVTKTHFPDTG